MKRLLILVAALAFSAGAAAQMYKWKDKNGHVRYGDTPPPGVDATRMGAPATGYAGPAAPAAPPGDVRSEKNGKGDKPLTPEQAFEKRQKERAAAEEKAEKERQLAATKRANCQSAQAQLRTLQSGQRMATINAAGERVFMDDEQRVAETARAQKAVSDWCN